VAEDRCPTSDLLVDQCGCAQHRGGQTPDEEAAAVRARLLAHPAWMAARYASVCARCGEPFLRGAAIRFEPSLGWRAECCAEVSR
jgi:hypothetical protein